MTPPSEAVEVQPRMKAMGVGRGGIAGQSQILRSGNSAWVSLSRGKWARIDASDIPLVAGLSWHAHPALGGSGFYAANSIKPVGHKHPFLIMMHKVIFSEDYDQMIDHADCDGLNNTRANLRACTAMQNSQNRRTNKNNSVGLKNVTYRKESGKYRARIHVDGKRVSLGSFDTAEEAHDAFSKAARAHHGDFARTE